MKRIKLDTLATGNDHVFDAEDMDEAMTESTDWAAQAELATDEGDLPEGWTVTDITEQFVQSRIDAAFIKGIDGAEMGVMSVAQMVAAGAGGDGQDFDWLEAACDVMGGRKLRYDVEHGSQVHEFSDGSSIVETEGGWDIRHDECTCGYCWAGAGWPRCLDIEDDE